MNKTRKKLTATPLKIHARGVLLLVGLILGTLFSGFGGTPIAFAPGGGGGLKNTNHASFTYAIDTHSSYHWIADLNNDDGATISGGVWIYDDDVYIYIWVGVWSKPYLAYGELEKTREMET